jgi:hypothetical protein
LNTMTDINHKTNELLLSHCRAAYTVLQWFFWHMKNFFKNRGGYVKNVLLKTNLFMLKISLGLKTQEKKLRIEFMTRM